MDPRAEETEAADGNRQRKQYDEMASHPGPPFDRP
jgi:hypothetical protein